MSLRTIKLLHVEDDEMQRRVLAHHLQGLEGLSFALTCVDNEESAIEAFQGGQNEFVVIDYQLSQGNGLSCLKRLRGLDPIVPIVAVSGMASTEIAAELIQAGADDYISKKDLNRVLLDDCLRSALKRADAVRKRGPMPPPSDQIEIQLEAICRVFVTAAGNDFLDRLLALETTASQTHLTQAQMQFAFRKICATLEAMQPPGSPPIKRLLRPVLLEILLRLFGELSGPSR